jgi:hypothetical protein
VSGMATISFTTEYKFTAKTAPKLLNAIEQQENKKTFLITMPKQLEQ